MTATDKDLSTLYPRRSNRKQRTRREIIKAALRLFREQGYKKTTMAHIADAADVHVTTVFNHFTAKIDLMYEISNRALENLEKSIAKHRGGEPFFIFYRAMVENAAKEQVASHSTDWFPSDDPEILPAWINYETQQATLLAQCIAEDYNLDADRDPRPTLVANMLVTGNIQTFKRWQESQHSIDLLNESLLIVDAAEQMVAENLSQKLKRRRKRKA